MAVQLVSRIRKDLDVEIYLAPIMSSPTVHDLAVLVVNERLSHVQDLELKELLGRMDSLSEEEIARLSEEYGLGD